MAAILDFRSELFLPFLIDKLPRHFLPSFDSIGLSVQAKKFLIHFQNDGYSGRFGFPLRTILASFDLQVIPLLHIVSMQLAFRFRREEVQNRFSRWLP